MARLGEAHRWRPVRLGVVATVFFLGLLTEAPAQQASNNSAVQKAPTAPEAGFPTSSGSIAGTVRDSRGDPLAGVKVALASEDDAVNRVVAAGDEGAFLFANLPPGTYRVKINLTGLEPFASAPIVVAAREKRYVPVDLRIATKTTTVDVVATSKDVAEAQVEQEQKQRMLGFLPNYYTSYIWNAAPMTRKLKFELALRSATDPTRFLVVAGTAGVEQAHKTFPGYGQGLEGYGKRYGAAYADTAAGRILGSAVFPILFHQDPRYFYQGSGSTRSRLLYALLSTVICRGDNGRLEPNYSHVLGSFAAAGFSSLYRAPQDRRASLTLRNGLIITGSGAIANVLREFISRKLTANVPAFANGKP